MKLDTSTDPQVGFRPPGELDVSTALLRYAGPFERRQAAHLLRRAGFGGTGDEISALAQTGAQRAVDVLVHPNGADEFVDLPPLSDLYAFKQPAVQSQSAQLWWLNRMLLARYPLVEKVALFWHGHFATGLQKVPAALMAAQIDLFRTQGLGDFRTLLQAVTRDPAMLVWLDNRFNYAKHPNENYAREVMELFTLGLGNYSEDDVKNAARAFTGITLDREYHAVEKPALHDAGVKTLLGRTGNFDVDDAIGIIVAQPIHERFLCRKLLEFFVYSDPEPELIEALASVYATSGYNVGRTLATIFRSNVFYSPRAYRALPKSPLEFAIGVLRFVRAPQVPVDTVGWLGRMGQVPLAPPNVKGWDGGPTWINTSTLLARFNFVNALVRSDPRRTAGAARAADPFGPLAQMPRTAAQLASLLEPEGIMGAGGADPKPILDRLIAEIVQDDATADFRRTILGYLDGKGSSVPQPFGPENSDERVRGALSLVFNLPANQLN